MMKPTMLTLFIITSIASLVASKTLSISLVSISVEDTVFSADVYGYIAEDNKEFSFTISRPRHRFSSTPTRLFKGIASVTSNGERTLGKIRYRLQAPYPDVLLYPNGGATLTDPLGIAVEYEEDDREPGMQGDKWRTDVTIPPKSMSIDYMYGTSVILFQLRHKDEPLSFEMDRTNW